MEITQSGWPLGASIACDVCDSAFTIEVGDAARVAVVGSALEVDADCPVCGTRYSASKEIGAVRTPQFSKAGVQYNVEDSEC